MVSGAMQELREPGCQPAVAMKVQSCRQRGGRDPRQAQAFLSEPFGESQDGIPAESLPACWLE